MLTGKKYKPEDIIRILFRRAWLILVPMAVVSGLTALAARQLPDRYLSETLILVVPQRVPDSYVKPTVTSRIEDRLESISQQILSRSRLERIIQDFSLYASERSRWPMEDVVEKMRRDITVQVVKGDSFRISYSGSPAPTVMKVTARLASLFIEENLRDREVLAEGTSAFLEAQLEDARRRLVEQEKKIEQYRLRYSGQLPSQLGSNLQVIQNAQMQLQTLTEALNLDRERRLLLERMLADMPTARSLPPVARVQQPDARAEEGGMTAAPGTAAEQLERARAMVTSLQVRLKPAHPDLIRAKRLVEELQREANEEALAMQASDERKSPTVPSEADNRVKEVKLDIEHLDREIARKEDLEKQLRATAAEYQGRVEAVPARESDMAELTRDYATLQSMYTTLLTKREDSKIAANLERRQIGEQFKLLDPARLPERPYSPNRPLIVLAGMAAGLLIGLGVVAVLEYLDTTFHTDEDALHALSIPVLAVVPIMYSPAERRHALGWRIAIGCALAMIVAAGFATAAYAIVR